MNIALLGFGVVGSGVYEWCRDREDLHVRRVLVRSEKPQIADIATHDFEDILHDDSIDIVAEVMGGLHPAYEYVTAALKAGKHVVTANKALIAAYYQELTELAKAQGKALLCTAAVGGGIPWLVNLARCKKLDTICRVGGIMNGTSNFIMDAMHKSPVSFPAILKQAQELGYAEADPSADIDGDDIRRKLVISANIAFDALLREEDIPMFGTAPSPTAISRPSRAGASPASCWRKQRRRKTACAPTSSQRWWTPRRWRPPCPPTSTSSPTRARTSAARAFTGRAQARWPLLPT